MRALGLFVVSVVAACGGTVERDPGTGGSPAVAGGTGGGGGAFPSTPLGDCSPGYPYEPGSDEPCPYLAEGLCYPDKLAACACVCPADHDSWCSSGYPTGGQPTVVTCD